MRSEGEVREYLGDLKLREVCYLGRQIAAKTREEREEAGDYLYNIRTQIHLLKRVLEIEDGG